MVVSTYFNGNLAYYKNENWYYYSDNSPVFNNPRPCPKCGVKIKDLEIVNV